MIFRFLEPAQTELLEGISYSRAIRAELGLRFEQAVADAVRSVVAHPEHGAPRSKNTRRRSLAGFPFQVIDRATDAEVLIVAIAHQRKRPEYWARHVDADQDNRGPHIDILWKTTFLKSDVAC